MTTPRIITSKVTNDQPVSSGIGDMFAITGPSSRGAYDTPIAMSRASDVVAMFEQGPLVEAVCYAIANYNASVVCTRAHATTAGANSAITTTRAAVTSPLSASTSVCTVDAGSTALGDYEFGFVVTRVISSAGASLTQGTLGTDHIYGKWTTDNFRTLSTEVKLPDASTFTLDLAQSSSGFDSGIQLDFAAGTLSVGDTFTGVTTAPACTTADLATANAALGSSRLSWEFVLLASAISDATPSTGVCAAMDTFIESLAARGLFKFWLSSASLPTVTAGVPQTDAAYQASSAVTNFATYASSTPVPMSAGGVLMASQNPTWPAQYIVPPSYGIAPRIKSVAPDISIADSDLGPLPGCSLVDGNRNPLARCHDEDINPGLDDARFCVLRTWPDTEGAYVNLPTLMAQSGSGFTIIQRLRLWNLFASVVWTFYRHRLQKGAPYDEAGHVIKSWAEDVDAAANLDVAAAMKGKCSAAKVAMLRTDDLRVRNPTLTVEGGFRPFAYPTFINLRLGFLLPG